ncbi:glycoside hydrolase family 25 [Sphingobium sp. H33]|uniref:Glycoside hydrolase family 25 n=2 Tax=Sphingobium nicotianae TaxID=2782607 RepID=A0A9X1AJZ9_9SPHN|nr:GH25 family lysozyme [Sphingobium nicotianae]MBT2185904.1 glycoside hydrolase family 25 [Sphingobium nicotianae]
MASRVHPTPRRRVKLTPLRILLAVLLGSALILTVLFLFVRGWTPSHSRYPMQGISLTAESGEVNWRMAHAAGADFAYLLATSGAETRDPSFDDYLAGAKAQGLRYGPIHRYNLCRLASEQATRFIATVPRDPAMLPPVVQLDFFPNCAKRPSRDTLLAELNTFLNQIETHSAKPALLRVSHDFEAEYDVASGINRTLWLEGDFFPPDYATRPWVMWTASTWKRVEGIDGPLEWDVVRP